MLDLKTMSKEIITTKVGINTLKLNGYLMHSKYDPIKESERIVNDNYKPNFVHILYGYGLGYIVEQFKKTMTAEDKLIVIEPFLDIEVDNKNILLINKVNSASEIKGMLFKNISVTDKVTLICSPNYDKVFAEEYKEFLNSLKDYLYIAKINENTIKISSDNWQKNYISNLSFAINDYSVKDLENIYECPVVVASGGPSLTKQLPILKKYRDNVIIVASGSTINSLVSAGIEPDYVVSVDGAKINYEHYKNLRTTKTSLIYLMSNYSEIRTVFNTECYYTLGHSEKKLHEHLSSIVNEEIVLFRGGPSCAHYAFDFAQYITSGPITLIGQDLAFTDNKTHADDNVLGKKIDNENIATTNYLEVEGYNGGKVLTNYSFLSMKENFESLIHQNSNKVRLFNSTEGGAKIYGINQISFINFCERYCKEHIEKILLEKTNRKKISKDELIQKLELEIELYSNMKLSLTDNKKVVLNNKSKISFSNSQLKKMDKNDKKFEETVHKTALRMSLDPINLEVLKNFKSKLNETPEQQYNRVKEQNLFFYTRMIQAIDNISLHTKELIENLREY